jgi:hypothetical protein
MTRSRQFLLLATTLLALVAPQASAQVYEKAPIHYWRRGPDDITAHWDQQHGLAKSRFDQSSPQAFLSSMLEELEVPPESQLLVFSTTSFQNRRISGEKPRALYFNENHYVGYVQDGPLELTTVDRRTGLNFYTVSVPEPQDRGFRVHRERNCLTCHADNSQTEFPGLMAFSVFATDSGSQVPRSRSITIDDTTPLASRWGGWYVTGTIEGPRHRGNAYFSPAENPAEEPMIERDFGASPANFAALLDMKPYLRSTSDVVALMVFEHQLRAHNQLLEAFGQSRIALYADPAFFKDGDFRPETLAVIDREIESLLDVMLFKAEADLSEHRIQGNSGFQTSFLKNARRDSHGRSLKDLDLNERLFRHRLSYMIYSDAFNHLPDTFRERFFARLDTVLKGTPAEDRFTHLPVPERQAIQSILAATLPRP